MPKLISPELFSQRFGLDPKLLERAGLLDPILNSDTKLFIDPLLLRRSKNVLVKTKGQQTLEGGFGDVVQLLIACQREGDVAWRGAFNRLDLSERAETCLGYGGSSPSGSSRPASLRNGILRTAKEITQLGESNPDIIPLMGLLEEGVGPDTISDMTTNLVLPTLAKLTAEFCAANGVPQRAWGTKYGSEHLPENPYFPGRPIILVPRDILRDLPIATDWSDVSRVAMEIAEIRKAVNALLGDWTKATVTERKRALRRAALASVATLKRLLAAVAGASDSYDEKQDLDGLFRFREVLGADRRAFAGLVAAPRANDQGALRETVDQIVEQFREMVENNNLWELLWYGAEPRHERAAQLMFFAVANVLCAANDIDISPETNSGGGPVDFKFSTGYRGRVLVEIKLSKGQVVHGYKTQLEVYKSAAKTFDAVFLVVNVGGIGNKLRMIQRAQAEAHQAGHRTSKIVVVDARRQRSASKR